MNGVQKLRLSVASSDCVDEDRAVSLDESCGIEFGCGSFKKKRFPFPSLQRFATTRWALCFLSLGTLIQGFIVNGQISSIISTLEKRFSLSSTESGLIVSCYEISGTLLVLFVTYIGGRGHKPIWIAWGMFFIGLSGVIFSLPHFIAPTYNFTPKLHACVNETIDVCETSELKVYRFVFYLAMLVAGAGSAPLYSLGVTFLDENVKQRYSALYNGIFVMASIIGPGLGYLAGGAFLSIYTNPSAEVTITESDNQWVGAWWLGPLVIGIIGVIVSFPTFFLPRVIPGTEKNRIGRGKEVHRNDTGNENDDFGKNFRDFPKCVYVLFQNPTFVFLTLGVTLDSLLIGGVAVFGPKFVEVQFGIDSSTAGTYFGLLAILGAAGGQIIGGGLLSKYDVKIRWMLHIGYLSPIVCVLFSFCFLITCTEIPFAGVTLSYQGVKNTSDLSLFAPCNSYCNCSESDFFPVCGNNHVTYFSACFAGCTIEENGIFSNCSCIQPSGNVLQALTATNGVCYDNECSSGWRMIVFCICLFGIMFFTFFNEAAALQVSLRCVTFNRRAFSIGLQILLLRAFGTLPGPLVVGAIFDSVCLRWSNECGTLGSCLAYDNSQLAMYSFLFVCFGKLLDSGLFFGALLVYKPLPNNDINDDSNLTSSNDDHSNDESKKVDKSNFSLNHQILPFSNFDAAKNEKFIKAEEKSALKMKPEPELHSDEEDDAKNGAS